MLKNNKGITLTILVVTVIVMIIILAITISTGDELLRNTQKNRIKSNMYLIKARAETLLEDYLFDGTDNLGTMAATYNQVQIMGWTWDYSESNYKYRIWDIEKLKEQGIEAKDITDEDEFVVKFDLTTAEVDVGITRGFEDSSGKMLFTLSELIEEDE